MRTPWSAGRPCGIWPVAAVALAAAPLVSCGTILSQGETARPLATSASLEAALHRIEILDTAESRLLYLYERGLVLHDFGDFRGSNEALDRAEALLEDLYTRSLSREAGALVTGDYLLEYRGERFEAGLVHYYKIMNHLRMGDVAAAAVECRKLNHKLQLFADQGGSFYANDPFLQYLTGLVYALAGEPADADVSLRVARDAYQSLQQGYGVEMPASLLCDLAENSRALGSLADTRRYREEGGCAESRPGEKRTGAVRLLLECGYVPLKVENSIVVPIYKDEITDDRDQDAFARELAGRRADPVVKHRELEYLLKVALPALRATPSPIEFARIRALPHDVGSSSGSAGEPAASATGTFLAANPAGLARRSFEEKEGEIVLRAVVRSLAKYLAQRGAEEKKGRASGRLVNLLGVVTEVADTRCWSALPEKILMGSLELPPGKYRLEVELFGGSRQRVGFLSLPEVEVRGGRSTILNQRVD